MNLKSRINESKAIVCVLESQVLKIELKFRTPSIGPLPYLLTNQF